MALLYFANFVKDNAAIIICFKIRWIQGNCPVVVRNCHVELTQFIKCICLDYYIGYLQTRRIQGDCLIVVLDCLMILTRLVEKCKPRL